jgi:heme exporter protein B
MRCFLALLKKDLLIEVRTKETVGVIVFLSIAIAVVAALGVNSAFVGGDVVRRLFPALTWIAFLFAATVSLGRSFEPELEHMAIEGVLLTGTSPAQVFVAKWLTASAITFFGQALTIVTLGVLLDVPLGEILGRYLIITALVVSGYAALATLLTALASTTRLKGVLLPILLLPLVFPIFFAAVELSLSVVLEGVLPLQSPWLSLLLGLDVVYFVLGLNLYEFVVRER